MGYNSVFQQETSDLNCVIGIDHTGFDDDAKADIELERRGLATRRPSPEEDGVVDKDCYVVAPTDLGKQTQEFLGSILVLGVSPMEDR